MITNMDVFEAVAARQITPERGAEIMLAMDRAKPWKAFVCVLVGHAEAVSMLSAPRAGYRWMCPRCGKYHQIVGGMLPPSW